MGCNCLVPLFTRRRGIACMVIHFDNTHPYEIVHSLYYIKLYIKLYTSASYGIYLNNHLHDPMMNQYKGHEPDLKNK